MRIAVMMIAVIVLLIACGNQDEKLQPTNDTVIEPGTDEIRAADRPAATAEPDRAVEEPAQAEAPTPTPSAEASLGTRVGGGTVASPEKAILVPPGDLITVEEHILTSDVIARVRLNTIAASSRLYDAGSWFRHVPTIHFTFDVLEVLQGSVGSSVVVEMTAADYTRYQTAEEAVDAAMNWIANRDSSRDDREALVFLWSLIKSWNTDTLQGRPDTVQYVFAANGNADWGDNYSIKSETNRVLLPATTSGASGASGSSGTSFHLEEPPEGEPGDTISLSNIKTKITTTHDMVDDTIPGHEECLLAKLKKERSGTPKLPLFHAERERSIGSGLPAGTALVTVTLTGKSTDEPYDRFFLDGPDSDRFQVTTTTWAPVAGEWWYSHDYSFETLRPLPKGEYVFHFGTQRQEFFPCNYTPSTRAKWTVDVEAPEGTLHELFFDPVTLRQAQGRPSVVVADASNGVLKPTGFTASNGASATVGSISWESGMVEIEVTPDDALAGQTLDIIELDGTVSLSLNVANSTLDSANNTLSWSVSEQPWHDGDKLMVRIREGRK